MASKRRGRSRYAAGAAGVAMLAMAVQFTSGWEGTRYKAYQDSGGVWTICQGITKGVHRGMTATKAECDAMFRKELVAHETRLLACAPEMWTVPAESYVAINDWAYNVGTGAACGSTLIRKVRAGDLKGACMQLSRWVYVKGRVSRGLVNRRVNGTPGRMSERELCLMGVLK